MFWATVSVGIRLNAWNTKPTRLRRRIVSRRSPSLMRSTSPRATEPEVGRSRPAATCRNVLFPDPDGPMIAVKEPRSSPTLIPSSATTAPSPRPWTFRTSHKATAAPVCSAGRRPRRPGLEVKARDFFGLPAETVMSEIPSLFSLWRSASGPLRAGGPTRYLCGSGRRPGRRRGRELVLFKPRKPLEPFGQVPVPLAEQLHRRRQQDASDECGVNQDRRCEPDAELLEDQHREGGEDRKDGDHDDRCARHYSGGGLDPVRDRLIHARATVERLPDPADDEDVVVHREAEQDHEQEQRRDGVDPGGGAEAEEALADAVLEDEHEHSVGGADREQVQHDRLDRDDDRAEGNE